MINYKTKLFFIAILIFSIFPFYTNAQYSPEAFVTKWQIPYPASPTSYSEDHIFLDTKGAFYYELFKLDGNTMTLVEEGTHFGNIEFTILEADTGIYVLSLIPDWSDAEPLHHFKMLPVFPHLTGSTGYKIIELIQWGEVEWSSLDSIMQDGRNLIITATDIPDLTNVTSAVRAFSSTFNMSNVPNIELWDVSGITDMSYMFRNAISFNDNIGNWDVSNVTNMRHMFVTAEVFNQDIGSWDVSNVTNMNGMFVGAEMFNQNIGNWDVSNVTDMSSMLSAAHSFNQDIGGWDVSSVTNMSHMFFNNTGFNQNIGDWNVSIVTDMSNMFAYTEMFNQDIGSWNVSNVTTMANMFREAKAFNQDISNWNVSNVSNMVVMFREAEEFNQNLGNWAIDALTNADGMFDYANMSCENYSLTLKGWHQNINKVNNAHPVTLGALNNFYSPEIEEERDYFINDLGWTIIGDNMGTCTLPIEEEEEEEEDSISIMELKEIKIDIYPNPVESILYLSMDYDIELEEIVVFNVLGQELIHLKVERKKANYSIDLSSLKSGLYFLEIRDSEQRSIKKKFTKF